MFICRYKKVFKKKVKGGLKFLKLEQNPATSQMSESLSSKLLSPPDHQSQRPTPQPFRWKSRITICPEEFFAVRQTGKFLHNWRRGCAQFHRALASLLRPLENHSIIQHQLLSRSIWQFWQQPPQKGGLTFVEVAGCCRRSWLLLVRNCFPHCTMCTLCSTMSLYPPLLP